MLSQFLLFESQLHQHRLKLQMQLYATKRSYSYWYKLLKRNRKFKPRTKYCIGELLCSALSHTLTCTPLTKFSTFLASFT